MVKETVCSRERSLDWFRRLLKCCTVRTPGKAAKESVTPASPECAEQGAESSMASME